MPRLLLYYFGFNIIYIFSKKKKRKKINRRVEILDIQDLSESNAEMEDQKPMTNNWTLLTTQNQMETCLA